MKFLLIIIVCGLFCARCSNAPGNSERVVAVDTTQSTAAKNLAVIAYYSGNATYTDSIDAAKLTHIIFSFGHLKGNRLSIDNAGDTATVHKLVDLKKKNSSLKVILSLGGWGGCEFCSPVFANASARAEFASSVKELSAYFKTDGIDLDWEYPAISGHPGHAFAKADRQNFTSLVKSIRDTLGPAMEISFAAGGFDTFIRESIEWDKVVPLVDKINIMSYDLVHGFSTVTGHHTPLYSTVDQQLSADHAIRALDSMKVPRDKMIIGAAFYARVWEKVSNVNKGLYQAGKFRSFVGHRRFDEMISARTGYTFYVDSIAQASYAYNEKEGLFATFDDARSVALKTKYAIDKGLAGIMFWELSLDKRSNGLLDAIHTAKVK